MSEGEPERISGTAKALFRSLGFKSKEQLFRSQYSSIARSIRNDFRHEGSEEYGHQDRHYVMSEDEEGGEEETQTEPQPSAAPKNFNLPEIKKAFALLLAEKQPNAELMGEVDFDVWKEFLSHVRSFHDEHKYLLARILETTLGKISDLDATLSFSVASRKSAIRYVNGILFEFSSDGELIRVAVCRTISSHCQAEIDDLREAPAKRRGSGVFQDHFLSNVIEQLLKKKTNWRESQKIKFRDQELTTVLMLKKSAMS